MDSAHRIRKRYGASLPHWSTEGGTYFITFSLAGSLPSSLAKNREERRREILANAERTQRPFTAQELDELEELHFDEVRLQRHDHGACFLKDERIARIVADALMHFDGTRYQLLAWVIMSNHVHVVFRPLPGWTVSSILHSWKSFSAQEANKVLRRTGTFWQEEYYDHLIRNEKDLERCIQYTWMNPDKAGIRGWKWRWKSGALVP